MAAAVVGACYGIFLVVTALRLPSGAELTGQFALQPAVKALAAVLLAVAALTHPIARERRWLVAALLFSAAGDFLLAMPWWEPSFVLGLGAFLVAHLCFLAALLPLAARSAPRLAAAAVTVVACVALLVWFWPRLIAEGMAVPVTLYIAVLGAMVCAALLARLPTPWTALGAVCFAVSDGDDRHRQVRSREPRRWPCRSGGRTPRRCCSSPRASSSAARCRLSRLLHLHR